jgi:hypothetical protein
MKLLKSSPNWPVFLLFTHLLICSFTHCLAQRDTITNYYTVENIPLPKGLRAETGGMDFMPDGRLVACFHLGEVMTYNPTTKVWKKFAEGLHDPLGLAVISNSEILVMQRPELTRLKDTNNDGIADHYETVTDDFGMSGNYHEFAFGPVKDRDGNYFIALNVASNGAGIRPEIRGTYDSLSRAGRMYSCVPYRGWVMKYLTKTGKLMPYASGFRSPNGLGFDANGNLFVSDNQGDWLGTSKLYHVEEGNFYGHVASLIWRPGFPRVKPLSLPVAKLDSLRTVEAVAFPHTEIAHSPTQPLLDNTNGKFGPFGGQLLVGEMDYGRLLRVQTEEIDGQRQGFCVALGDGTGLIKGNNRLVFDKTGALWIGHNDHGWVGDEGLQRIKWTGKTPLDILNVKLTKTGFDVTFTLPIDPKTAIKEQFNLRRYYYEYHQAYGSKQFDITPVAVQSLSLSADKRTVSLNLSDLKAGYIYDLKLGDIRTEKGQILMNHAAYYTLNRLYKTAPNMNNQSLIDNYSGAKLVVSSGGGVTGAWREYCVLENGQVYARNHLATDFVAHKKLSKAETELIFKEIEAQKWQPLNQPGNVYKSISWKKGTQEIMIKWGYPGIKPNKQALALYEKVLLAIRS